MIALSPNDKETVKHILHKYAPNRKVGVFGSRNTGTNKPFSDLDLILLDGQKLSSIEMSNLRNAFTESNLNFRVDVVEQMDVESSFADSIRQSLTILQEPGSSQNHVQ